MGGVLVFTTLLAGAYPAFYISNFNASQIFRGGAKFGGTNLFSRFLLGFQVMISLITVIAGLGFSRNAQFQRDYDYGYDRAGLMGVSVPDRNAYEALRSGTTTSGGGIRSGYPPPHWVWQSLCRCRIGGTKTRSRLFRGGRELLRNHGLALGCGRCV